MSRLVEALEKAADGPRALRQAGLHICTYHALCLVIKTIVDDHETAYTIWPEVANWCRKQPELVVDDLGTTGTWWAIRWKGDEDASEHQGRELL